MNTYTRLTLAAAAALLITSAGAEESPVYESLSDVSIGRVFFSASQRTYLDRMRGSRRTIVASSTATKPKHTAPVSADAAGFILSSSGKARVYRNGDFVEVSSEPKVTFPDDVDVTRKSNAESDTDDDGDR